jgi:guanylate kinase
MESPLTNCSDTSEPLMIVISGPSGVGKDAVIAELKKLDANFHFVVTMNTRERRPNEEEGKDYYFVSRTRFAEMIENDELIEFAPVYSDFKGIPKKDVQEALASGKDVILRLDVQGAATVRKKYPQAVTIFLKTKDDEELEKRLRQRKTETEGDFYLRKALSHHELTRICEFDYVVVNHEGQLKQTVETILCIITAEHHRTEHRKLNL